jgi:glycosyltransferase involved in cell wall biosynthesis
MPSEQRTDQSPEGSSRLLFVVNEAHFFVTHRIALAREAVRLGYDVHLAAPADHVWAPDSFDISSLASEGITYHEIPISRRGQRPLEELKSLFYIGRLLLTLRPGIVHLLTIKPIIYGSIAARLLGVPLVVCAFTGLGHIFSSAGRGAGLRRSVVLAALRWGLSSRRAIAIFQSQNDQSALIEAGAVRESQSRIIAGSGVDLTEFLPSPLPTGTPLVIFAGRLIWEKGVSAFVDAARIIQSDGVDVRFAIVGNTHTSNPRAVPEEMLRKWVKEGTIEWWGRREDMPDVLAQARVVCLPTWYGEGVPRVLIEAAACGRAVVASDLPGCREVVVDGVSGYLVSTEDADALSLALKRLLASPPLCIRFGSAARKIAIEKHDVRAVVRATINCYQQA